MGEPNLIGNEVKEDLRSLKPNKYPEYDSIFWNMVKETSDIFFNPFKYISNLSLQEGISTENLKIAKVPQ